MAPLSVYKKTTVYIFTCILLLTILVFTPSGMAGNHEISLQPVALELNELIKTPEHGRIFGWPKSKPKSVVFSNDLGFSEVIVLDTPDLPTDRLYNDFCQKAQQIGVVQKFTETLKVSAAAKPKWLYTPDGQKVWSLLIKSKGAKGLRINLQNLQWPEGAVFVITGLSDPEQSLGPYSSADFADSQDFWTETVYDEAVILEFQIPAQADENIFALEISRIAHIHVSFSDVLFPQSVGDCHIDISCEDSEWQISGKGVARYSFIREDRAYVCTGSLLNNTARDFTDYFLTAFHCTGDQSVASTTEYYWFYQTPSCNAPPPQLSAVQRTGGGADFLRGQDRNDFALLRLRQETPVGVTYLGWDFDRQAIYSDVRGIHHPGGTHKRISSGLIMLDDPNYWTIVWHSGSTEEGSSGSPLLNASRQVIGQLEGGTASCDNMFGWDDYGRFDKTFPLVARWLVPEGLPDRVKADIIFNWLESEFPLILSPSRQPTQEVDGILFRYYSETNVYTGVINKQLHFLDHHGVLHNLGAVDAWLSFMGV